MNIEDIKVGMRVKTTRLHSTRGMIVKEHHLKVRKAGLEGTVKGYVPGHGGDVWWVEHNDGSVGAYCFNEFRPLLLKKEKKH